MQIAKILYIFYIFSAGSMIIIIIVLLFMIGVVFLFAIIFLDFLVYRVCSTNDNVIVSKVFHFFRFCWARIGSASIGNMSDAMIELFSCRRILYESLTCIMRRNTT